MLLSLHRISDKASSGRTKCFFNHSTPRRAFKYVLCFLVIVFLNSSIQLRIFFKLVCSIHPIPGDFYFIWSINPIQCQPVEAISVEYRVDTILSLIMVGRLYIFMRAYLLHLKMFHGKFLVIGNLNAINFDIGFKIKTLMTFYPGRVLLVFNTFFFIISSWYLRLTEREHDIKFDDYAKCLWLIFVTFITIGYGDLTPVTSLGRAICIITGFMGISSSALIIAVLAQKLSLSKAEQLVHSYISNDKLKVQVTQL